MGAVPQPQGEELVLTAALPGFFSSLCTSYLFLTNNLRQIQSAFKEGGHLEVISGLSSLHTSSSTFLPLFPCPPFPSFPLCAPVLPPPLPCLLTVLPQPLKNEQSNFPALEMKVASNPLVPGRGLPSFPGCHAGKGWAEGTRQPPRALMVTSPARRPMQHWPPFRHFLPPPSPKLLQRLD